MDPNEQFTGDLARELAQRDGLKAVIQGEVGAVGSNYLIYDGNCPFCSNYVRFTRLRENIGSVDLIDALTGQCPLKTPCVQNKADIVDVIALRQAGN